MEKGLGATPPGRGGGSKPALPCPSSWPPGGLVSCLGERKETLSTGFREDGGRRAGSPSLTDLLTFLDSGDGALDPAPGCTSPNPSATPNQTTYLFLPQS